MTKTHVTLEKHLATLLPDNRTFTIKAFELWADGDGSYSVNDAWFMARNVDREEALRALRGRWEVFKANYAPKARVQDIRDIGYEDSHISLEVDCLAFADIEIDPQPSL